MRQLASIQRITDIRPIEGKDRIVQCHVNGWNVIIKKDEFNEGDLGVYVEIDSQLPEKPEFEFLRPKKFRIKTMKMSGVLSEGIVFPLSILPVREKPYELGEDVTGLMGVTKYDPQEEEDWWKKLQQEPRRKSFWEKLPLMRFKWYRAIVKSKSRKGGFPSFIPKSDETRIQNCPWVLQDKNTRWLASEKVDGCSATYLLLRKRRFLLPDRFEFMVCSRNCRLARDDSHYWKIADKYEIEKKLRSLIGKQDWIAVQGEIIGPKIQKNKYKLTDYDFYVFNLLNPSQCKDGKTWYRHPSLYAARLLSEFGIKFVPILDTGITLPDTVDEVLAIAHGQSQLGGTLREGIVFRSMDGQQSFKAVDPEFLIHYNI
jgi:hypothetical protein